MKFIKSYDNFNTSELKKYAVWKWNNYKDKLHNGYEIIEITEIAEIENDNDIIWCRDIYVFGDDKLLKKANDNGQSSFSMEKYGDCIIYVSDDLNECLEFLKSIIDSEKYNL